MKFLLVIIIAAIALAVAIAAYIKNDREWERAARAWRKDNEDLDRKVCNLSREKKIAEKRIEEQAKEISATEKEYFCAQNEVEVLESKLRDANALIKRYDGIFNGFNIVHDPSGVRECYLEIDGARIIIQGGKISGWYDNNVPEKAREDACEAMEIGSDTGNTCETPLSNYRWIKIMTVEEMARMIVNFEEMAVLSCDPKYCEGRPSDLHCPPLSDGEDREERCYRATVKWLMDLHEEAETETGGKEGPGEERQSAEPAEATEE